MKRRPLRWIVAAACAALLCVAASASASEGSGADQLNLIIGTQAIGGPYQHTQRPYLLEVASEIQAMGSNLIKFSLSPRSYAKKPYRMKRVKGIASMTDLLTRHPVMQKLMKMPFRYYVVWAHPYNQEKWADGLEADEETRIYNEFYVLARRLLTEYSGTDKVFLLGHWEGDWVLIGKQDPAVDPTPERIRGYAQYLRVRQRAVDDAKAQTPHRGVSVYHYAEVNLVQKGIDGRRPTLTNSVLPLVDVDFVSYSAYDSIFADDPRQALHAALDHIEAQLRPRDGLRGKRVFVGEFAVKASAVGFDPQEHDRRNREIAHATIEWGCPLALYWQFYCNEPSPDRPQPYEGFWLVDHRGDPTPLYSTLRGYWRSASRFASKTLRETGEPPTPSEIREFALEYFKPTP
ncbi:MAG: hypothetical protein AAGJ46_15305 [Planctomycetota bacterium]